LAHEIESLEHQVKSSGTPIGTLFALDRDEARRGRLTILTAAAFVMAHMIEATFLRGGTAALMKARHKRLVKDRNIARNVGAFVAVFGDGVIPMMCGSSWPSA